LHFKEKKEKFFRQLLSRADEPCNRSEFSSPSSVSGNDFVLRSETFSDLFNAGLSVLRPNRWRVIGEFPCWSGGQG